MTPAPLRLLALVLCLVLSVEPALGALSESSLWNERNAAARQKSSPGSGQIARLPGSPAAASLFKALPDLAAPRPNAPPSAFAPQRLPAGLDGWRSAVPARLGSVREAFVGQDQGRRPVILVQDVHANVEAQENIAGLLTGWIQDRSVAAVGVEGAFDTLDFRRLRGFPLEVRRHLADLYLEKKRLAAPSYVGWTAEITPPPFVGVDDPALHAANVSAYLETGPLRQRASKNLSALRRDTEAAKQDLNAALRRFDRLRNDFHAGRLGLGGYLDGLTAFNPSFTWSLEQFHEAHAMETSIDFSRASAERQSVLETLAARLPAAELNGLLSRAIAHKSGDMGLGEFYQHFRVLCAANNVNLRRRPAFDAYLRYVLLADGINPETVLRDVATVEAALEKRMVTTQREADVIARSSWIALADKLLRFELTPADWMRYGVLSVKEAVRPVKAAVGDLSPVETFYQAADERSAVMTDRLRQNAADGALILVTGGFHTAAIAERLRKEGASYMVVAPRLTRLDDGPSYLSAFSREKTPLDRLFSGEKLFVANPDTNVGHIPLRNELLVESAVDAYRRNLPILPEIEMTVTPVDPPVLRVEGKDLEPVHVASDAELPDGWREVAEREAGGVYVDGQLSFWNDPTYRKVGWWAESIAKGIATLGLAYYLKDVFSAPIGSFLSELDVVFQTALEGAPLFTGLDPMFVLVPIAGFIVTFAFFLPLHGVADLFAARRGRQLTDAELAALRDKAARSGYVVISGQTLRNLAMLVQILVASAAMAYLGTFDPPPLETAVVLAAIMITGVISLSWGQLSRKADEIQAREIENESVAAPVRNWDLMEWGALVLDGIAFAAVVAAIAQFGLTFQDRALVTTFYAGGHALAHLAWNKWMMDRKTPGGMLAFGQWFKPALGERDLTPEEQRRLLELVQRRGLTLVDVFDLADEGILNPAIQAAYNEWALQWRDPVERKFIRHLTAILPLLLEANGPEAEVSVALGAAAEFVIRGPGDRLLILFNNLSLRLTWNGTGLKAQIFDKARNTLVQENEIPLEVGQSLIVGRAETSDIRVADNTVSQVNTSLQLIADERGLVLRVEDKGSRNGAKAIGRARGLTARIGGQQQGRRAGGRTRVVGSDQIELELGRGVYARAAVDARGLVLAQTSGDGGDVGNEVRAERGTGTIGRDTRNTLVLVQGELSERRFLRSSGNHARVTQRSVGDIALIDVEDTRSLMGTVVRTPADSGRSAGTSGPPRVDPIRRTGGSGDSTVRERGILIPQRQDPPAPPVDPVPPADVRAESREPFPVKRVNLQEAGAWLNVHKDEKLVIVESPSSRSASSGMDRDRSADGIFAEMENGAVVPMRVDGDVRFVRIRSLTSGLEDPSGPLLVATPEQVEAHLASGLVRFTVEKLPGRGVEQLTAAEVRERIALREVVPVDDDGTVRFLRFPSGAAPFYSPGVLAATPGEIDPAIMDAAARFGAVGVGLGALFYLAASARSAYRQAGGWTGLRLNAIERRLNSDVDLEKRLSIRIHLAGWSLFQGLMVAATTGVVPFIQLVTPMALLFYLIVVALLVAMMVAEEFRDMDASVFGVSFAGGLVPLLFLPLAGTLPIFYAMPLFLILPFAVNRAIAFRFLPPAISSVEIDQLLDILADPGLKPFAPRAAALLLRIANDADPAIIRPRHAIQAVHLLASEPPIADAVVEFLFRLRNDRHTVLTRFVRMDIDELFDMAYVESEDIRNESIRLIGGVLGSRSNLTTDGALVAQLLSLAAKNDNRMRGSVASAIAEHESNPYLSSRPPDARATYLDDVLVFHQREMARLAKDDALENAEANAAYLQLVRRAVFSGVESFRAPEAFEPMTKFVSDLELVISQRVLAGFEPGNQDRSIEELELEFEQGLLLGDPNGLGAVTDALGARQVPARFVYQSGVGFRFIYTGSRGAAGAWVAVVMNLARWVGLRLSVATAARVSTIMEVGLTAALLATVDPAPALLIWTSSNLVLHAFGVVARDPVSGRLEVLSARALGDPTRRARFLKAYGWALLIAATSLLALAPAVADQSFLWTLAASTVLHLPLTFAGTRETELAAVGGETAALFSDAPEDAAAVLAILDRLLPVEPRGVDAAVAPQLAGVNALLREEVPALLRAALRRRTDTASKKREVASLLAGIARATAEDSEADSLRRTIREALATADADTPVYLHFLVTAEATGSLVRNLRIAAEEVARVNAERPDSAALVITATSVRAETIARDALGTEDASALVRRADGDDYEPSESAERFLSLTTALARTLAATGVNIADPRVWETARLRHFAENAGGLTLQSDFLVGLLSRPGVDADEIDEMLRRQNLLHVLMANLAAPLQPGDLDAINSGRIRALLIGA